MAINEQILTGRKWRRLIDKAAGLWQRISYWTHSSDVEFNDGKNAETKVGAIDGITDSLASTSSRIAASAKSVNQLNNNLVSNVYVGTDGKIHVVKGGADTGLNFSNVISALTKLSFKAATRVDSISVTNGKHYLIACIITCDAVTPAPDASLTLSGCTTLAVSNGACGVYSSGRMKLFFVKATSTTIKAKQTGGYIYAQID